MRLTRCIGCNQDFDTENRRSDVKYCPACEPLRHHRGLNGGRFPVAELRAMGTTCGVCRGSISFDYHYPDPRTPSVDHMVPKALGGSDAAGNLQIVHLWCNQAKHLRRTTQRWAHEERQRFYNLRAWRRLAKSIRLEEPTCRQCGEPSRYASHIVALEFGGMPWERSNIEALCLRCRNVKAQAIYRAGL
jgi:5-methylcytosine-specific restriction endonuclease McrA